MGTGRLRFAADTGGTFTDLVVEEEGGVSRLFKRPTTPSNPVDGILDVVGAAAEGMGETVESLLGRSDLFVFGTTRATNAIVTNTTARTGLLITEGHRDVLLFREGGGRYSLFDYSQEYPDPYIPRELTFEVKERMNSLGEVIEPLDEDNLREQIQKLKDADIESVAVSLLWSTVNSSHEARIGELLDAELPGIPYTLSHELNPSLREYRRTSSAAIDASLKPLMSGFLRTFEAEMKEAGFNGRLLVMTSAGGVLDAAAVAETPIHSIGSGPAGAPVAAKHYAEAQGLQATAIITDAGGTTYDVGLLRDGQIPMTRETVVGDPVAGYMTGFPSVDVKSVGAGGGSIAWVDAGGMLHVGPQSAGADPGPACYGRGGDKPTVTDACLVMGYMDPDYFLGGAIDVDVDRAIKAIERDVAEPLNLSLHEAADAILTLAMERMVTAIEEITLTQGVDVKSGIMIGGGGGAGLYSAGIATRLDCWPVVIPEASAAISATGAMLSDLKGGFATTEYMISSNFNLARANEILSVLDDECDAFMKRAGVGAAGHKSFYVEARYDQQVWEIELPLPSSKFASQADVEKFVNSFHDLHDSLFSVRDEEAAVEVLTWGARIACPLREPGSFSPPSAPGQRGDVSQRDVYFAATGLAKTNVLQAGALPVGEPKPGPVLVESPVTTLVVPPHCTVERTATGSILLDLKKD